jgi:hypothetical protein
MLLHLEVLFQSQFQGEVLGLELRALPLLGRYSST